MKIAEIREINELLTKAFQQECSLIDNHKLFYRFFSQGKSENNQTEPEFVAINLSN